MSKNEDIDMQGAVRVAYADTKHLGRPRWSELSVHYLPNRSDNEKRWVALSVGMSSKDGEVPITDKLATFALESCLKLFDDSPIGSKVKAEAIDWAAHNLPEGDETAGHPVAKTSPRFNPKDDLEALAYLFGDETPRSHQADALGINESTLRAQLRGKGVRVALRSVLPFMDREAFLAAVRGRTSGNA